MTRTTKSKKLVESEEATIVTRALVVAWAVLNPGERRIWARRLTDDRGP